MIVRRRGTTSLGLSAFAVVLLATHVEASRDARGAAAPPSPASRAGAPHEPPASPHVGPLLDARRGQRAVVAYRKFVDDLCNGFWLTPEGTPMRPRWGAGYNLERSPAAHRGNDECEGKLTRVGLQGADEITLCSSANAPAVPVASGAFVEPGGDEVLLAVWNGRRWPGDDQSLALMRDDGRGYGFVAHMLRGPGFKPLVRFATSTGRDVLMLCRTAGGLGPSAGVCGFLGQGSFGGSAPSMDGDESPEAADRRARRDLEAGVADPNEIAFDSGPDCGRGRSVILGKVEPRGGRLFVDLVAEESLREHGPEDLDGNGCSRVTTTARQPFTIEYVFDGAGFRRAPRSPKAAQERPREPGRRLFPGTVDSR